MEESDRHILEGLLQARSDDLRQARRPRSRRPAANRAADHPPQAAAPRAPDRPAAPETVPATRACASCGEPIPERRVRAMPSATLCLDCRRASEARAARS